MLYAKAMTQISGLSAAARVQLVPVDNENREEPPFHYRPNSLLSWLSIKRSAFHYIRTCFSCAFRETGANLYGARGEKESRKKSIPTVQSALLMRAVNK
jgi:hypothetical protein